MAEKLTRRDFIKGAAVGGVAGLVVGGGGTALLMPEKEEKPWIPEKWDKEADVVVAGYGTAGMPAAIEAHDAGAEVIILEKLDWLGGSCRRCGGGIAGAGTSIQRALGVEDSPDLLYEYLIADGEGLTDPELTRVYVDNAGKNVDWIIEEMGAKMPVKLVENVTVIPGLNTGATPTAERCEELGFPDIPRCHWMTPYEEAWKDSPYDGGTEFFRVLHGAIEARKIQTMLETALVELAADANGEVLGVKVESRGKTLHIKARRGVILATGGFRNNEKMLKNFNPKLLGEGTIVHPDQAHGEGIIAGHSIGAALVNMSLNCMTLECDGGLRINPKAQVIDVFGKVIPRLYAAGCTAAGVIGGVHYPSCGTYVAVAVCFGRIGGKNAAALEPWS